MSRQIAVIYRTATARVSRIISRDDGQIDYSALAPGEAVIAIGEANYRNLDQILAGLGIKLTGK
jgi:hypothetical protein